MSEFEWLSIFGDNLKSLLKEAGMTQEELANATGLSKSTISRYIHKEQIPTIRAIINISYELDCDLNDLIDFGDRIYW